MKTSFRRVFIVAMFLFVFLTATPLPASAHAQIVSSNPSNGERLTKSPDVIEILFSENISTNSHSIRLFDEKGNRIAVKGPIVAQGSKISAPINKLSRGTFVVAWSATSEDTHPIKGAFSFSVDSILKTDVTNNKELSKIFDDEVGSAFQVNIFSVLRFLILTSIAMVIALVAIKSFIYEGEVPSVVEKILKISIFICIGASLGAFIVQAALANGLSILGAVNRATLKSQFGTRYGFASLVRVLLCLGLGLTWKNSNKLRLASRFALSVALAATLSFSGHAIAGKFVALAVLFDVLHVLAASVWLGGVATLPFFLNDKSGVKYAKKFSKVALYCVMVLVATGVFGWWRQIGSLDAASTTWFGQLVSFKSLAVLLLIVIAYFSRKHVAGINDNSSVVHKKRLVKLVYIESIILVLVLVSTTILINTIPARTALAMPISRSIPVDTGYLEITVDPAKVGPTVIHAYMLNENGTPYPAIDTGVSLNNQVMTATLSNEDQDVSGIPIEMRFQGLNHFVSLDSKLPFPGTWKLTIRIELDTFNVIVAETQFKVRP